MAYTGWRRDTEKNMTLHVKKALLSALVFPGLGQVLKGSKVKGLLLIAATNILLVAAFVLVLKALTSGVLLMGTPEMNDPARIASAVEPALPGLKWVLRLFFLVWLYGTIDALLASRYPK
jgi:hypothetical protein